MLLVTLFTVFNITACLSLLILRGKHILAFFNAMFLYAFILVFGLLGDHRPPAMVMLLALPALLCMEVAATSSSSS